ncbi:MAG TPA: hypothetical protein VKF82_01030 [Candidatus Eremiobacteraceae bacterium]|nr:hypothetical protein [Candidatus Eremiobacteraceae bacterium]
MRARPGDNTTRSLMPVYLCLVGLGSIVAHIASEFFAMGPDADSIALSPKHLYLGIAALVCAIVAVQQAVALWRSSSSGRDLKRQLHVGLESLPFRGRGAFYAFTAALQFGIGLTTQIGEGCPFCGHDIGAGIAGTILTVFLMALAGRAIGRRLPTIAAAIAAFFVQPSSRPQALIATRNVAVLGLPRFIWFSQLYNRPPPSLSIA